MNEKTIQFLKDNKGDVLKEINGGYKSINTLLENVISELTKKTDKLQKDKEYNQVMKLIEIQKDVNDSITNNFNIMNNFDLNVSKQKNTQVKKQTRRVPAPAGFDDYEVNTNEPHEITEDFRFKRPHAFELDGNYEESSTWKEMLVKTCKQLYKIDPNKFKSFAKDESMGWGDTHNFSNDKALIREPHLISDSGVYIEIAKGSMGIRQMIIKMLSKYDIDQSLFKVYLRADYSIKRELDDTYRRRQA